MVEIIDEKGLFPISIDHHRGVFSGQRATPEQTQGIGNEHLEQLRILKHPSSNAPTREQIINNGWSKLQPKRKRVKASD